MRITATCRKIFGVFVDGGSASCGIYSAEFVDCMRSVHDLALLALQIESIAAGAISKIRLSLTFLSLNGDTHAELLDHF